MIYTILSKLKEWLSSRLLPIAIFYFVLAGILISKLYQIQILGTKQVTEKEEYKLVRERTTSSTRGLIYDCKNRLLAGNELSYSVILEDSPNLNTNAKKNAMLYQLIHLLQEENVALEPEFYLRLNESGILEYTVEGTARLRFLKNALGKKSIDNLSEEEKLLTAEELFSLLRYGNQKFGEMYNISESYSIEDALEIMSVRYAIFTLWPKYSQITLATGISDTMIAALKENAATLPGISVIMQTKRVYYYSEFLAHIIGYTGQITEAELEESNLQGLDYLATDVIGKTGIEKAYEDVLNGEKGVERLTLDNNLRIVNTEVTKEPQSGNNVVLTIDAELQKAYYYMIEQELADILLSHITEKLDYGTKGTSADNIQIPIFEVYDALFSNNVLNTNAVFSAQDTETATENEIKIAGKVNKEYLSTIARIEDALEFQGKKKGSDYSEETAEFLSFLYTKLTANSVNLIPANKIDKLSNEYLAYMEGEIGLAEFLEYCINRGLVNIEQLGVSNFYVTDEVYHLLLNRLFELLSEDITFKKMILRNMIFSGKLTGAEICMLLFDQSVLDYDEDDYLSLKKGSFTAYSFIRRKIKSTEITPAQLALEPCGASLVITDVKNGDVKVMVTYPSYDNNRLANKIDWDYYQQLMADKSNPLSSRVTDSKTTTGSTFKMITSFAGYGEKELGLYEKIDDLGEFTKIDPSPKCWYYPHKHGKIDVPLALYHSCNYFYYEVGYRLSLDINGKYSDSLGIAKLTKYAEMFGLGAKSGIEVSELSPQISTKDAVRTSIGYFHSFTPSQIARYITTLANNGTCYNLTLVNSITDRLGELVQKNHAAVYHQITEFSDAEWEQVHKGVYLVLNSNDSTGRMYDKLGVDVAGKSGTAEISKTKPSNALLVSYAPYEDPEIAVTVVIPNGYTSTNVVNFGYDVYDYYFHPETFDINYKKLSSD